MFIKYNFKVFHISRNRYLTDDELEGQFYFNGIIHEENEGSWEDIDEFKVNLVTGKIQTDQDNACMDPECCSSCDLFADNDDFIIEVHKA